MQDRNTPKYYYLEEEGKRIPILLGKVIGQGTESVIHDVICPDDKLPSKKYMGTHVAKIYNKPATKEYVMKLNSLIYTWQTGGKQLSGFCFPRCLVFDKDTQGRCVGFIMPYYNANRLDQIFSCFMDQRPDHRWKRPPQLRNIDMEWTQAELATLALNILRKLKELHKWGIYMCDFNPKNILVGRNQETWFVDVDSYQVGQHACPVYREEYSSPRLVELGCPAGEMLTEDDVNYSIAVLLFQIFFVGMHPYVRSGGGKTYEQLIKDRDFAYPLTYKVNYIPKGSWQKIWYSLPLYIKKCFHDAFTTDNCPDVDTWISVISKYKAYIETSRTRQPISKMADTQLQQNQVFLGYEDHDGNYFEFDPAQCPALRQFDTDITGEETPVKENHLVLEFGSNSIHSYTFHKNEWRPIHFRTMHSCLIDKEGKMDVEMLKEKLIGSNILSSIRNITPAVTKIHAFGGICLRMLSNRQEVIDALRDTLNINFGVLTSKEETSIIAQTVIGSDPVLRTKPTLVADVGGFATDLITRLPDGTLARHTYSQLGSSTLTNWLFSTNLRSSDISMVFETHDNCIENYRWDIGLSEEHDPWMVCTGAISEILSKGETLRWVTIKELEQLKEELSEDLTSIRQQLSELYVDVLKSRRIISRKMDRKTVLRLTLPIYINLMKMLNVHTACIQRFGLGKPFACNCLAADTSNSSNA